MKVKEIMDKDFVSVSPHQGLEEASLKMEKNRKFTTPVVDENMKLMGWITTLDITRGFREGKETIQEIMHNKQSVYHVHEDDPARLAVLESAKHKLVSMPVLNDEGIVVGLVRTYDIVENLSQLYEIKVYKIFKAMEQELKGVSWDELMEAAAIITRRRTGHRIKPEEYEQRIRESTFGEAIWATGGMEKFFVGLIAIGELVIARKVARARK